MSSWSSCPRSTSAPWRIASACSCPSDHRQVSLGSALASACPLVVPRVDSSFQPRVFHVLAQTGAQSHREGWEWPGELRVGEAWGSGRQKERCPEKQRLADKGLTGDARKYSFPDVMMPSYSRNPWSCVFFIVYLHRAVLYHEPGEGSGLCSGPALCHRCAGHCGG